MGNNILKRVNLHTEIFEQDANIKYKIELDFITEVTYFDNKDNKRYLFEALHTKIYKIKKKVALRFDL